MWKWINELKSLAQDDRVGGEARILAQIVCNVCATPPLKRFVALAFVKGELFGNIEELDPRELRRSEDRTRHVLAI